MSFLSFDKKPLQLYQNRVINREDCSLEVSPEAPLDLTTPVVTQCQCVSDECSFVSRLPTQLQVIPGTSVSVSVEG